MVRRYGMKTENICISCLGDFKDKDIYWVRKQDMYVLYCMDCIKKLGIENYNPYSKPKKRKVKE